MSSIDKTHNWREGTMVLDVELKLTVKYKEICKPHEEGEDDCTLYYDVYLEDDTDCEWNIEDLVAKEDRDFIECNIIGALEEADE